MMTTSPPVDLRRGGPRTSKRTQGLETRFYRRTGAGPLPAELTLARMTFQQHAYVIVVARDISKRKAAEAALGESERSRLRLETQSEFAAQVQQRLLPRDAPELPGFDVAARCLPAYQVGGDFYDWQETAPGFFSRYLGDVMGKGPAAAMLMATVRASLRAVAQQSCRPQRCTRPSWRYARTSPTPRASSPCFMPASSSRRGGCAMSIAVTACVFMLRTDGSIEELLPRGLPFGVLAGRSFMEGQVEFPPGATAQVLFSDGLIQRRQV